MSPEAVRPTAQTGRPRRTQAQRRAATRTALLDATIACLVEDGYAGTTTRRVAARAGVTPGALQHHFPNRAMLVTEALRQLADRLVAQLLEPSVAESSSDAQRAEALLDRLWEVHRGPLFEAAIELWVAARTDSALDEHLDAVAQDFSLRVAEGALYAFPGLVARPGFAEAVVTGLATLRGLALQGFVPGGDPDADWPATRAHLLALFEAVAPSDAGHRS